jgi:hypothetical protein
MAGFSAARQHRVLRGRSIFHAASACSEKTELTQWAYSVEKLGNFSADIYSER